MSVGLRIGRGVSVGYGAGLGSEEARVAEVPPVGEYPLGVTHHMKHPELQPATKYPNHRTE